MIMVKANKNSEDGVMPSAQLLIGMGKFNEMLAKAGVLISSDGLQPSSKDTRVRFTGKKRTVIDGPFAETKELIAGFWMLKCNSLQKRSTGSSSAPVPCPARKPESRSAPAHFSKGSQSAKEAIDRVVS
jgi:hypothetical protein